MSTETMPEYTNPNHTKFVEDMERAGLPVFHYEGRWYWSGPAVRSDRREGIEPDDITRATSVRLQRDNMGLDFVLYPVG